MTNGLKFFLAFYILVGQPALLGWMLDNGSLYKLAGLNACVFIISRIISAMSKSSKKNIENESNDNKVKLVEKTEEKVSRIENDNGVSIVEVAKKEIVVESNETENQGENTESLVENTEEKSEGKISDKPMRESVTIPKIVQPLTGHSTQTNKKKHKERKRGQRLILLLTLGLAAVIAWTLWEFLGNRGLAIAMFLGRILYLVIGKLFDVNGFYNAKKLFTNWLYIILIFAGVCYGIYAMQDDNSLNLVKDKAASYIKDLFNSENDSDLGSGDAIYVFEGTGEVITDTGDINVLDNTGIIQNETGIIENVIENTINSGIIADTQPEVKQETQPAETVETITPTDNPNREVTRGEAIKHLLQGYTLSTKKDVAFVYVAKSNELYPYFKTAQEKAMIGFDVNPSKRISCETYMALKGILEGWTVNIYDRSQTRVIYWNKANELGKTNGCARGAFVKAKNL